MIARSCERERNVVRDEGRQGFGGRCGLAHGNARAVAQLDDDTIDQRDQQLLLVGEVAVDRRAGDAGRRTDLVDPHRVEPTLGHQFCRRVQQLLPPGEPARGDGRHSC